MPEGAGEKVFPGVNRRSTDDPEVWRMIQEGLRACQHSQEARLKGLEQVIFDLNGQMADRKAEIATAKAEHEDELQEVQHVAKDAQAKVDAAWKAIDGPEDGLRVRLLRLDDSKMGMVTNMWADWSKAKNWIIAGVLIAAAANLLPYIFPGARPAAQKVVAQDEQAIVTGAVRAIIQELPELMKAVRAEEKRSGN